MNKIQAKNPEDFNDEMSFSSDISICFASENESNESNDGD